MSRYSVVLAVVVTVITIFSFSSQAHANIVPTWLSAWWYDITGQEQSEIKNKDYEPYLESATETHNSQWDNVDWQPDDWIAQRDNEVELIRDFYDADILSDQYVRAGVPVLEVGPAFYRLGGEDKRRVTDTVDQVYKITEQSVDGMFILRDWRSNADIGLYTKYGLQLH